MRIRDVGFLFPAEAAWSGAAHPLAGVMRFPLYHAVEVCAVLAVLCVRCLCEGSAGSAGSKCPDYCLKFSSEEHQRLCCSGQYPVLNEFVLNVDPNDFFAVRAQHGLAPATLDATKFIIDDLLNNSRVCFPAYEQVGIGHHERRTPRRQKLMKACFPSVIIGCCAKSGTGALMTFLAEHPRIRMPSHELHYFNRDNSLQRLGNYLGQLPLLGYDSDAIVMEKSPGYAQHTYESYKGIQAIQKALPTAKLIYSLREPAHQLYSWYWHCSSHRSCGRVISKQFRTRRSSSSSADEDLIRRSFFESSYTCLGETPCCYPHMLRTFFDQLVENTIKGFENASAVVLDDEVLATMNSESGSSRMETVVPLLQSARLAVVLNDDIIHYPASVMRALSVFVGADCSPNCGACPPLDWSEGFRTWRDGTHISTRKTLSTSTLRHRRHSVDGKLPVDNSQKTKTPVEEQSFHCYNDVCLKAGKGRSYPPLEERTHVLVSLLYRNSVRRLADVLGSTYFFRKWFVYSDPRVVAPPLKEKAVVNGVLRECQQLGSDVAYNISMLETD